MSKLLHSCSCDHPSDIETITHEDCFSQRNPSRKNTQRVVLKWVCSVLGTDYQVLGTMPDPSTIGNGTVPTSASNPLAQPKISLVSESCRTLFIATKPFLGHSQGFLPIICKFYRCLGIWQRWMTPLGHWSCQSLRTTTEQPRFSGLQNRLYYLVFY